MTLAESSAASRSSRRTLWTVLLILCFLWLGFVAGMVIGGRLVPAGSGLAGPAIALVYGVGGAVTGAILAGVLAWKLPPRPLRLAAMAAILLSALTVAFVAYRVAKVAGQLAESRARGCPQLTLERKAARRFGSIPERASNQGRGWSRIS